MVTVRIEYCAPCGYTDRATGLVTELLKDYEDHVESVVLVPSDGGRFEVTLDGELIFSKLNVKRHAQPGEVVGLVGARLVAGP
jgi:selenoprotein W-related protein